MHYPPLRGADLAVVIETERLRLRELDPGRDAAAMLALLNDPGFQAGIGDRGVRTEAQAADYLRSWAGAQYATHGFGHYLIQLRDAGAFVGTAGLIQRPDLQVPDIGYALLGAYRGQGYAYEAAQAVMRYARDVLGLRALCAIVSPDNAASRRLLEKLGLRRDGEYVIAAERAPLAYYTVALG
ncbi:MAG TPA: GNAT family N-acetyltransferase [Xanthomonadaceae bacterium]|nr:GNAT family N-acetyltransferase [Xanthomonadaceae bacterium]